MFYLNISSKSPSSLFCKKNSRELVFWVFSEQLLHYIIFGSHIFTLRKEIVESQEKKTRAFWEFNVCSLIASQFKSCLHYDALHFHISHFTHHLKYYMINWSLLKDVNNALTSYIKLYNYVMLNSNEPIKVAHLQKLANQSVLNGALVIEKWLNNSFSESKKNFCRLIKLWTLKICISTRFC